MAIINRDDNSQPNIQNDSKNIMFVCPVCKSSKSLKILRSILNQAKQLTTISIPKNKICEHHFQAFIDKQFTIRGYQRVDFEFPT
ncbi:MAG: hypothetical protein ACFFAN_01975 [Promethearchaeota archaeon]